jgi:hypothetical protein
MTHKDVPQKSMAAAIDFCGEAGKAWFGLWALNKSDLFNTSLAERLTGFLSSDAEKCMIGVSQ